MIRHRRVPCKTPGCKVKEAKYDGRCRRCHGAWARAFDAAQAASKALESFPVMARSVKVGDLLLSEVFALVGGRIVRTEVAARVTHVEIDGPQFYQRRVRILLDNGQGFEEREDMGRVRHVRSPKTGDLTRKCRVCGSERADGGPVEHYETCSQKFSLGDVAR